ncbi:hypothetical protein J1614_001056 [Plenodomus biglobosus]|nr:hypothetical protein J1614_001056 [Plenodomus biglobosus]
MGRGGYDTTNPGAHGSSVAAEAVKAHEQQRVENEVGIDETWEMMRITSTNAVEAEAEEQQQQQQQRDELDRLIRSKKSTGIRVCLKFLLMDYICMYVCVWVSNYYVQDARPGAKAQEEDEESKEKEEVTRP